MKLLNTELRKVATAMLFLVMVAVYSVLFVVLSNNTGPMFNFWFVIFIIPVSIPTLLREIRQKQFDFFGAPLTVVCMTFWFIWLYLIWP